MNVATKPLELITSANVDRFARAVEPKPMPIKALEGKALRKVFVYSQMDFHRGASVEQQGRKYDGRELIPTFTTREPIDLGDTYEVSDIVAVISHLNRGTPSDKIELIEKLDAIMKEEQIDPVYDAIGVYAYDPDEPVAGL